MTKATPIVQNLAGLVASHARSILCDPCIPVIGPDVRPAFALALELLEREGKIPGEDPELREKVEGAPCPFCGGAVKVGGGDHPPPLKLARAWCSKCQANGPGNYFSTEAEALAAWNQRAATRERRALEELRTEMESERLRHLTAVSDYALSDGTRTHESGRAVGLEIAIEALDRIAAKHRPALARRTNDLQEALRLQGVYLGPDATEALVKALASLKEDAS